MIKIKNEELFIVEQTAKQFLEKTENDKEFNNSVPFELKYWMTKLFNKSQSVLKDVRDDFVKLRKEFKIDSLDENKTLREALGSKFDEFSEKEKVILNESSELSLYKKPVSLFAKTKIGGVMLNGLLSVLEDDLDGSENIEESEEILPEE